MINTSFQGLVLIKYSNLWLLLSPTLVKCYQYEFETGMSILSFFTGVDYFLLDMSSLLRNKTWVYVFKAI